MKILVIGDSHGNIINLKHAMGFGKKIGVEAVIHCGDWNNTISLDTVLSYKLPLYTVLGNADIDPLLKQKLKDESVGFDEEVLQIELNGKKILISHYFGKLKKIKEKFDIGFYGHLHSQDKKEIDGKIFVRPGALENGINFCIYDTILGGIEFFTI